ncbi:MAG: helix-turn-helix transcriptional regulator [Dichotomicrobium sp.]
MSTEREQAAYLLRHLRIAWKIANKFERLKTRTSTLEASLDRLAIGTVLIDSEKRVISTNQRAKAILATRELRVADGRLRTVEMKTRRQLNDLLSALVGEDGGAPRGGAVTIGRFDGSALQIWGTPLHPQPGHVHLVLNSGDHARAILFILDPDRKSEPPASFLKDAFGLTAAESALALALSRGDTVDGYCEQTGISRNTARTHMRHIFEKLNIHKQNDLIRLLHGAHMFELGQDH